MLTPQTVTRHELTGLPARVADAPNPDLVGIAGRVVRETTNTLVIRRPASRDAAAVAASSDTDGAAATADRPARARTVTGGVSGSRSEADGRPAAGRSSIEGVERASGAVSETNRATDEMSDGRTRFAAATDDAQVPKRGTTFEFVVPTDEAADAEASGSAFELPWETAGTGPTRPAGKSGGCENVGYVTVDGARLIAHPARRTERAGDTLWQSD